MTLETTPASLEIDMTYGGVYAGTSFEFSEEVTAHYNQVASSADDVLEGEFVSFSPGEHFSIACPIDKSWPKAEFVSAYNQLDALLDGSDRIHLGDHPHLFSNDPSDASRIRAVPTYIPKASMPEDFFGRTHSIEIFQGDRRIFGPAQRFFHTRVSGSVYNQIEDGHDRLVVEIRGEPDFLNKQTQVVFFTDPVFGEPSGATQLNDDGSARSLSYRLLGKDHIGDTCVFNEGLVPGLSPQGDRLVVELHLPNKGTGLAAALYDGHTRDLAYRVDANVL
jgi:hypothetical protein